jgi:hypothetical protein
MFLKQGIPLRTAVGGERLELSWFSPTDPKSVLSTNFSNRPKTLIIKRKLKGQNASLEDDTSAALSLSRQPAFSAK